MHIRPNMYCSKQTMIECLCKMHIERIEERLSDCRLSRNHPYWIFIFSGVPCQKRFSFKCDNFAYKTLMSKEGSMKCQNKQGAFAELPMFPKLYWYFWHLWCIGGWWHCFDFLPIQVKIQVVLWIFDWFGIFSCIYCVWSNDDWWFNHIKQIINSYIVKSL